MTRVITFFERNGFVDKNGLITTQLADLNLDMDDRLALSELSVILEGQVCKVLDVSFSHVRAIDIVGVFRCNSVTVEILPKLYEPSQTRFSVNKSVSNLIHLLSVTDMHNIDLELDSNQGSEFGSLLDAIIDRFANLMELYIATGLTKQYVSTEGHTASIRGRIDFSKGKTFPPICTLTPYCKWDEFQVDNPLNQTLAKVCLSASRLASDSDLRAKILSLASRMTIYITDAPADYATLLPTGSTSTKVSQLKKSALQILRFESPSLFADAGVQPVIAFNMYDLFEKYVGYLIGRLKNQLKLTRVEIQKGRKLISGKKEVGERDFSLVSLRNTFSDIILQTESGQLVIDTKYKILDGELSALGVKNADFFQIIAYQAIHSKGTATKALILYPMVDKTLRRAFRINSEADYQIVVSTLNFNRDLLELETEMLSELSEILRFAFAS